MTCFEVVTIFPDVVETFVRAGVLGKAIDRDVVQVHCTNPRDFAEDKHHTVDDAPFGGGAGMVMTPGPVVAALEAIHDARGPAHRVLLTPAAPCFDQRVAERLAGLPRIVLVCGRYEGIDERVREHFIDECLSIGDFVLGGGEVAALVVIEAVSRLVDGVLGNPTSAVSESFSHAGEGTILEYPQYTRPAEFRGHRVPEVLVGGDHGAIARWRQQAARQRTWALRPDLRPRRSFTSDAPLWLAVDVSQAGAVAELAAVAAHHRVDGIALLHASAEDAVAWATATGGTTPAIAFAGLQALRRRLRRASGADPWVVRLAAADSEQDELPHARSAAELADALALPEGEPARALVLWLADDAGPSRRDADAVYAPSGGPLADPDAGRGLAIPDAIVDGAAPRQRPAVLANVALATLPRPQPDRPGDNDSTERDEP